MSGDRVIRLYRSNRTEVLADQLAQLLAAPIGGPLDPEWVVVQGRGMAVWLAMELARRHGVCAGLELVYPANLVRRLVDGLGTEHAERAAAWYDGRLTWSLMSALGGVADDRALSPLANYLDGDEACRRRHALATRLADQLDHYAIYRSDMIRAWDRGDDEVAARHGEAWQPVLWRRLVSTLGDGHAAALEQELLTALVGVGSRDEGEGAGRELVSKVPPRIVVFGLVSLPPMYLRVLAALSHHAEIHWFMPSPAAGYWADLVSSKALTRARARGQSPEAIHLEQGHPLLVSCGRLAADTLDVMTQQLEAMGVGEREPIGDLHRESGADTVLGRLQDDILRGRPGDHAGRGSDDSITIHACHGPMREVEVLHDQLLARLHGDGDLRPDQIVVMMADVDAYAPLVEAVFTRDRNDERFIPFSIADRAPRQDSPAVDAFQRALALIGGRAKLSELVDLLALEPVQRRFGVAPSDLDRLREWLAEAGVRWGIDAAHRAAHDQPAVDENTWRFGLERLLLGYAMPTEGRGLFAERLPYDEVEGQDAILLGRAVAFAERVFALVRDLATPRPVTAWRPALLSVLDDLLATTPEQAWQLQQIRDAIEAMARAADGAGFDEPIDAEVVRRFLEGHLDDRGPARGFLVGGVTFCAMVPMRSIPFRVVALLGMADGAFPRTQRPQEHDLMRKPGERRPGDRSRRDDDRYLFLEALLAARDQLIITYPGQSVRDNAPLPPSVVVSELIDELVGSYGGDVGATDDLEVIAAVHPTLLTRHPLQPFSPRYFDGSSPQLFSYDQTLCDGARALVGKSEEMGRRVAPPLFDRPLPEGDEADDLQLAQLIRFFENPVRHLMRQRLGVDLRERDAAASDREPVELDGLERYRLGDVLLGLCLDGVAAAQLETLTRASGLLAPGTPGHLDHEAVMATVVPMAARVRALREGGRRPDLPLSRRLDDGTKLMGAIGDLWTSGLVKHQYARVSGKNVVALWLRHLALCWAGAERARSHLVGRGKRHSLTTLTLRPVEEPARHLADLVALYRVGQRSPLHLFPKSAATFIATLRDGKSEDAAWRAASTLWLNEERSRDPHLVRAFPPDASVLRGDDDGAGFEALARRVFEPIYDHLEEGST